MQEATPLQFVQTSHWAPVRHLAFSDDGRYVASHGEDFSVRVWDAVQRQAVRIFLVRRDVTGLAWDGDSRLLVERQQPLRHEHGLLLDVATGKPAATIGSTLAVAPWRGGHPEERWAALVRSGLVIYARGGDKQREVAIPPPCRVQDERRAAMAEGGGAFVLADCGQPFDTMRVFRRHDDTFDVEPRRLPDVKGTVAQMAISGDGAMVLVRYYRDDRSAPNTPRTPRLWLVDGKGARPLDDTAEESDLSLLSRDGTWAAAASPDGIRAWRTSDGHELWHIPMPSTTLALSPSGRELAVGRHDGRIVMLDAGTGRTLAELGHLLRRATKVAFEGEDRVVVQSAAGQSSWSLSRAELSGRVANEAPEPSAAPAVRVRSSRRGGGRAPRDVDPAPASPDLDRARAFVPGATAAAAAGDILLAGDAEGGLTVIGKHSPQPRPHGESDGLAIEQVVASASGKLAATVSMDGAVRIWDAKTAMLRAIIYDFDDEEWLVATPRGAYVGTTEVSDRIGWVFDAPAEYFGADRYRDAFRQPELVRRRLAGEPVDASPELVRPPRVEVLDSPRAPVDAASARLQVSVGGASRLSVRAYAEGQLAESTTSCATGKVPLDVPLAQGINRIAVVAFDERGHASNPAWVDVTAKRATRPDVWVVAIGVSQYPRLSEEAQLPAASEDARGIAEAFSGLAGSDKAFARAHVKLLRNEEVDAPAALSALAGLEGMAPGDLAIVSFAGHGAKPTESADMVFLTGKVAGLTANDVRAAGIAWPDVAARLARAKGRVVVLLDACHAGHFSQEEVVPNATLAGGLASSRRAGVLVLAASKGRQLSYELAGARSLTLVKTAVERKVIAPGGHGLFTGALLASLASGTEGDRNGDGTLQLSELIDQVTQRVTEASGGRQTPWIVRRELFGDFALTPVTR